MLLKIFLVAVFITQIAVAEEKSKFSRATLDGVELDYEIRGAGEPVVFVHGGFLINGFKPLMDDPNLLKRYRLITYHRAGYGNSTHLKSPVTISDHARHLRMLLEYLKIPRAHIVGHSSGGSIALQLALDSPGIVNSIVLLESARPSTMSDIQKNFSATVSQVAMRTYKAGDKTAATDIWMRGICSPDYREAMDKAVPGAFDEAVDGADTFFGQEVPAILEWVLTKDDAAHIKQPILAMLGEKSHPVFRERRALILGWFSNIEPYDLPNANHLMQIQNPGGVSAALIKFFTKHPITKTPK
jgi:pimeloyl-ACP methyl ester carboxylesterase